MTEFENYLNILNSEKLRYNLLIKSFEDFLAEFF